MITETQAGSKPWVLCTLMWQDGYGVEKFAYLCGIRLARLWAFLCGLETLTVKEVDRICTRLRITPDLRAYIFGEVQDG